MIYEYEALSVIEVHDGDTFRLMLDVGFETGKFPWLRLKDFSCPELHQKGGPEARDVTYGLLTEAAEAGTLLVQTFKRPGYEDMSKSFARYLARTELAPGRLLGDELVKGGHAQPGARVG